LVNPCGTCDAAARLRAEASTDTTTNRRADVALLTAMGIVPVEAENVVLSASAVVAGIALSKG
jgi:hypothetical protein